MAELRYMLLSSAEDVNFFGYHCPTNCKMANSLRKKIKEIGDAYVERVFFLYAFENWLDSTKSDNPQPDYCSAVEYFKSFSDSDRKLWVKTGCVGVMHVFVPKYS